MIRADPSALRLLFRFRPFRRACQKAVDAFRTDKPSAPVADPCRLQTAPPDQIAHGPGANAQTLRRLSDGQIRRRFLFVMQMPRSLPYQLRCVPLSRPCLRPAAPCSRCAGCCFMFPVSMPPTKAGCQMLCIHAQGQSRPAGRPRPTLYRM